MQATFPVLDSAKPLQHDLLFLKTPAASLKIIEIEDLKKRREAKQTGRIEFIIQNRL